MCWSSSSTTTDTSTSVWMAAPVWSRDRLVLIWGVTISPLNGKIDQSEQDRQFYKRFLFLFAPTCFFASKEKKYTPEMTHLALGQPAAALSSVCMKMIYWLVLEETLGLFLFSEIHYWFLWGEGTLGEKILTWTKVIILHLLICLGRGLLGPDLRWTNYVGNRITIILLFTVESLKASIFC